jgi:hypothetical protein
MIEENKAVNNNEETVDISDEEIAVLANKEIRKRDNEIIELKKELAKLKLYSDAEENQESDELSIEQYKKILSDGNASNYDIALAVTKIARHEVENGRPNPLGKDGGKVCDFFEDVINECAEDKSRFVSIYQAKIGADDKKTAMAYNKRKQER